MASDAAAHVDRVYEALARSRVYRDVLHAAMDDLPEWLVPFSITDTADLARVAKEMSVGPADTFVDLGSPDIRSGRLASSNA